MSDVGKIRKASEGPEPRKSKKVDRDSDAFRKAMKQVRETDPEEKRKRKSQAEAEEEQKAATKPSDMPSQGLESKLPAFFETPGGTQEIGSDDASASETSRSLPTPPPEEPPPFFQPPPETEPDIIEDPEISQPQKQQPTREKKKTEKKKEALPPPIQKKPPAKGKTAPAPPASSKEEVQPPSKKAPPKKKETIAEKDKAPSEPGVMPAKKAGKPTEIQPEKKKKKEIDAGIETPPPALPSGAWEATKEGDKDKQSGLVTEGQTPTETFTSGLPAPPPGAETPPPLAAPFANLPPQVAALFERMAGVMTVMTNSGVTETTIDLSNPQFAESTFYGAQIVITEFSTAPKAFNIELLGNQQAVALFSENSQDLVAAFQAGKYNFKVNRIETGYLPAKGEAKRRETRRVKRKKSGGG